MNLSICLITRGRQDYLKQLLKSFDRALEDPEVRVHLVDNGSKPASSSLLSEWANSHPGRATLYRFETNDPRYSTLWPAILESNAEWLIMPGDDDEFRPEIIKEFKMAIARKPNLVAYAASAAVMSSSGSLTGERLNPTAGLVSSQVERVARAFHQPAFVWPALFFRPSMVAPEIPASRYAFDWWVGVSLLLAGDIETSESFAVNYRTHATQESNLAPLRRKYFEGSLWLDSLARGPQFLSWASDLSDEEKLLFWQAILAKRPIYSDPASLQPLLGTLARTLIDTAKSTTTGREIAGSLAGLAGVYLKNGESFSLTSDFSAISTHDLGNLTAVAQMNVCQRISNACQMIQSKGSPDSFTVGCDHSKRIVSEINIACEQMSEDANVLQIADQIVNEITTYCEARGDLQLTLSDGEKLVITSLRRLKQKLPGGLKLLLRKMKNRAG